MFQRKVRIYDAATVILLFRYFAFNSAILSLPNVVDKFLLFLGLAGYAWIIINQGIKKKSFAVCVIFIPEVRHGSTVESITNLFQSKECFWYRMALSIGYYPTVIVLAFQYSLHIGIYVLLGLCVSVFCTNRYVFYAMPFLLTRIGMYIGGFVGLYAYIPYGRELLADGGWGVCLTRNLAAYAVLGFLYYREMKWRGING